jgi:hypothetical protein
LSVTTKGVVSYIPESTYSVRNPLEPVIGTVPTSFGKIPGGRFPKIPAPKGEIFERYVNTSQRADSLRYGKFTVEGEITYEPLNGIGLYYAMMKIANADGTPNTHTITEIDTGGTKPSRTFHYEEQGGAVERAYDFPGVLVNSFDMAATRTKPVTFTERFRAQRAVDNASGISNEAVIYTTAPALPTGSGTTPYTWNSNWVASHETNSILSALQAWTFNVQNTWIDRPGSSRSGNDEYSNPVAKWMEDFLHDKQKYAVDLTLLRGTANTFDIEKNLYAEVLSNDLVLTVQRSATDYIELTFDTTECLVLPPDATLTEYKTDDKFAVYKLVPRSVTAVVKDAIAGADFK